jgi:hypothetical protein
MLVQWCLKGIALSASFGDAEAHRVLTTTGILSRWAWSNGHRTLDAAWPDAHAALSDAALAAHVNAYGSVAAGTPFISLSAGVIERDPTTRVAIPHSAWTTALDFATRGGTTEGYVFECWVQLPGNPAPELPGFGEEVRDLNLHRGFAWWHHEGEVAAKLVVPPRQIQRVTKFAPDLRPIGGLVNHDFVPPERISNIRQLVV